jgi:jmjN domain
MAETTCPVYRPSLLEFNDFQRYIQDVIDHEAVTAGCHTGIVKVIPPSGWFETKPAYDAIDLRIGSPIKQVAGGRGGVYSVHLYELEEMSLGEFLQYADSSKCDDPDFASRERLFWKSLGSASKWMDPIYGADLPG